MDTRFGSPNIHYVQQRVLAPIHRKDECRGVLKG